MPARFDEALEAIDGDDRVAALRPAVVEWCERLAASPMPASIDHNDLHAFNILAGERFYDWGDAVVAHPFASMLALEWVDTDAAGRERLRDAYLEPFADFAPTRSSSRRSRSRAASAGSRERSCGSARSGRPARSPSTTTGARRRASGCGRCSESMPGR